MNNSICTATVGTEKNGADKKTRLIGMFLLPLFLLPCIAHATVYKCVVSDTITYSGTPCANGKSNATLNKVSVLPGYVDTRSAASNADYASQLLPEGHIREDMKYGSL